MLWVVVLLVFLLFIFVYLKAIQSHQHWKEKEVPYMKPWPIFGNMAPIAFRTQAFAHLQQDAYNSFPDQRYFGFYQFSLPTLMIRDPNLIKQICIKDFDTFSDHLELLPESSDPFWNKNLFSMAGQEWHSMRAVLSPAFTSRKMKGMFYLMAECAQQFSNHFQQQEETVTVDIKDTFMRFTNDVIASTAFGIKCDSLHHRDNEFFRVGKNAFDFTGLKSLKFFGYAISPALMKILNVKFFDDHTKDFFRGVVRDTIRHREQTGLVRPDMIHLLREAQKGRLQNDDDNSVVDSGFAVVREAISEKPKRLGKPEITEEDIVAQATIFFFGGFDTVATLMTHIAYELAVNPNVQEKLIEEVDRTFEACGEQVTYEILLGMKYLDMVTSETLRMWPPGLILNRKTVKPYTIPPAQSGEKSLHLEAGTACWFPVYAIQRDPQYYPNPDRFDPERFSDENRGRIPPFTYLPFGVGPRSCIASRFALLEAKTVIFFLLTRFGFVPVEKTHIPFILSKKNIIIDSDEGYWLGLKPRKQCANVTKN